MLLRSQLPNVPPRLPLSGVVGLHAQPVDLGGQLVEVRGEGGQLEVEAVSQESNIESHSLGLEK